MACALVRAGLAAAAARPPQRALALFAAPARALATDAARPPAAPSSTLSAEEQQRRRALAEMAGTAPDLDGLSEEYRRAFLEHKRPAYVPHRIRRRLVTATEVPTTEVVPPDGLPIPMRPDTKAFTDRVFDDVFERVHKKEIGLSKMVKLMNDAEREMYMTDATAHPNPPSPEKARKVIADKVQQWANEEHEEAEMMTLLKKWIVLGVFKSRHTTAKGKLDSHIALVVGGNCDGLACFGTGKAKSVETAVKKARKNAMRNLVYVPRFEGRTIAFPVEGYHNGTKVMLKPAPRGNGVRAGFEVYTICDLLGISDLTTKILTGNGNDFSNIYAIFHAFQQVRSIRDVALRTGMTVYRTMELSASDRWWDTRGARRAIVPSREALQKRQLQARKWMLAAEENSRQMRMKLRERARAGVMGPTDDFLAEHGVAVAKPSLLLADPTRVVATVPAV